MKSIEGPLRNVHMTWRYCTLNFELTLPAPCILESCIKIKINLNFYFHASLWCLKRFYEDQNFKLIFSLRQRSARERLKVTELKLLCSLKFRIVLCSGSYKSFRLTNRLLPTWQHHYVLCNPGYLIMFLLNPNYSIVFWFHIF